MLTRDLIVMLLGTCVASACFAEGNAGAPAQKETVYVIKVSDFARKNTYEVMTPAEFKDIQQQIAKEAKFFPEALDRAEKEWAKDEELKKKPFPKTAIAQRKATQEGDVYNDRSKATDKAGRLADKDSQKEREDASKLTTQYAAQRKAAGLDKKTKPEAEKEAEDKLRLMDKARELFVGQLNQLTGGNLPVPTPSVQDDKSDKKQDKKDAAKKGANNN